MATPRKRFFTVECSLYREPWPRELKLTAVMLGMHMTDRWAADGLTPAQATVAHLTDGDLMTITGAPTLPEQLEILRQLAAVLTIKVQPLGNGFTRIEWRKLAKTQWSQSRKSGSLSGRSRDKVSPKIAPSHPHSSQKSEAEKKKKQNSESEKNYETPADAGRSTPVRPRKALPPERLMPEQMAALRAWCTEKAPAALDRFDELVAACLDFHRGKGNAMADWPATCRTWIRNDARFGAPRAGPGGVAARADERAQVMADNARAAVRLVEERERAERERRDRAAGRPADPHVRQLRAGGDPVAH